MVLCSVPWGTMRLNHFRKKKRPQHPWKILKFESIQEIEKRVHQCTRHANADLYFSVIHHYIDECQHFLPEQCANELETFLLERYGFL